MSRKKKVVLTPEQIKAEKIDRLERDIKAIDAISVALDFCEDNSATDVIKFIALGVGEACKLIADELILVHDLYNFRHYRWADARIPHQVPPMEKREIILRIIGLYKMAENFYRKPRNYHVRANNMKENAENWQTVLNAEVVTPIMDIKVNQVS